MPVSNSSNKALKAWSERHGTNFSEEDGTSTATLRELRVLGLRAQVTPTKDASQLAKALNNVLNTAEDLAVSDHPSIRSLTADPRLPGWARLAAALGLNDVEKTKDLARYVPALASRLESETWLPLKVKADAFAALSLSRRLRLVSSGLRTSSKFSTDELIATLKETKGTSWRPNVKNFTRSIAWGESFKFEITKIESIKNLGILSAEDIFFLASDLFDERKPTERTELKQALEALAGYLGDVKPELRPTKYSMFGLDEARILLEDADPNRSEYWHLAGIFASSSQVQHLDVDLAVKLAHPASAWALKSALQYAPKPSVVAAIHALVKQPKVDPALIDALIYGITPSSDYLWMNEPEVKELYDALGPKGYKLLFYPVERLSRNLGYGTQKEDPLKSLPLWATEAITMMSPKTSDHAPRAWAQMVDQGYVPANTVMITNASPLLHELAGLLLNSVRYPDRTENSPILEAWLRKLSVVDFAYLIDESHLYNVKCKAGDKIAAEITDLIEEGLSLCGSDRARRMVITALMNPQEISNQPKTFLSFAKEISNITETLS